MRLFETETAFLGLLYNNTVILQGNYHIGHLVGCSTSVLNHLQALPHALSGAASAASPKGTA